MDPAAKSVGDVRVHAAAAERRGGGDGGRRRPGQVQVAATGAAGGEALVGVAVAGAPSRQGEGGNGGMAHNLMGNEIIEMNTSCTANVRLKPRETCNTIDLCVCYLKECHCLS